MREDPLILSLDLATRTGWALGTVYERYPRSGSVRFAPQGASMGTVFVNCKDWLWQVVKDTRNIDVVVFETPMTPSQMVGRSNINTVRLLIGLAAITEEFFTRHKFDVREARVSEVRHHFIKGNPKRVIAKTKTIAACKRLGWTPHDDNAADALALWHYQASVFEPKLTLQTSPLFQRGA